MGKRTRPVEVLRSGQMACPGCGLALGMRMVLRAMGPRTVVVVVPSCVAVTSGPFPYAALGVPAFHSAFEIAAPTAAIAFSRLWIPTGVNCSAPITFASSPSHARLMPLSRVSVTAMR